MYMSEHEPKPQEEMTDHKLLATIEDAIELFESPEELDQLYLENQVLPRLEDYFERDLLASEDTLSFLREQQAKLQQDSNEGV